VRPRCASATPMHKPFSMRAYRGVR
jgi:hypothetical protein